MDVYKRLLGYSLRYKKELSIAILMMIVTALTQPAFAALMRPLTDEAFVQSEMAGAPKIAGFLFLVLLLNGFAGFISGTFMSKIGWNVVSGLREELFAKYVSMPTGFFDSASSGKLISSITYNTEQVAEAATNSITLLIRDGVAVISLIAMMFYLDYRMAMGFLLAAPIVTLIVNYVTRRFRRISTRIQNSMGDVAHVTEEMVNAHRVVKIFGGHRYEKENFKTANDFNRTQNIKLVVTKSASTPIVQLCVAMVLVGAILFAANPTLERPVTAGTFVAFMTCMLLLMPAIKGLTQVNPRIQKGVAAGAKIFKVLDGDEEVDSGSRTMERAAGKLQFEGVNFKYEGAEKNVLNDINFTVEVGQTVAFVGFSGSGKSTLINLLPRLYNPDSGRILLDDISIDQLSLRQLRAQIAYVGQEVALFNDSIRNNIAYGELNGHDDASIIAAAKAANAWEFIEALPDGLDTVTGEKGMLLSGGQRQRLAIARALLKNAPILILDEATASLDSNSERLIQAAIEHASKDRTTLVIAHRLSTIENADMILVLDEGRIVESGVHADLLTRDGRYAQLYAMQFSAPQEA